VTSVPHQGATTRSPLEVDEDVLPSTVHRNVGPLAAGAAACTSSWRSTTNRPPMTNVRPVESGWSAYGAASKPW
jgi:hypothetical protein